MRHIMKGIVRTAFSFIIDHRVMNYIRACRIEESKRVCGTDWSLYQEKAAYGANHLKVAFLWNNIWEPNFFSETMNRNNLTFYNFCSISSVLFIP